MTPAGLARRGLAHYWRTHLIVVLGVAVAVSVLAGALVVGESVKTSLRELAVSRLGPVDELVASTGFFRSELAASLGALRGIPTAAGFIALDGLAADGTNARRASNVAIYGIDDTFFRFHLAIPGDEKGPFGGRQALVTPALARDLGVTAGDSVLVRLPSPSVVPSATLHGRRDTLGKTMRATVQAVLPDSGLGRFSLRPSQGDVRAIFLPLDRVQREIERTGRINAIVVSRGEVSGDMVLEGFSGDVAQAVKTAMTLADAGVSLRPTPSGAVSIESDSGILSDRIVAAARRTIAPQERATPVFAYLAHTIRAGGREIPYAVVAGVELQRLVPGAVAIRDDQIWLNAWAAEGLGAKAGDAVTIGYDVWDDAGAMVSRESRFTVGGILPMSGVGADPTLTPDFPGISDKTTVADWDPSFPVDLSRITPRDDEYWKQHKAAPKAFVSYATADRLWSGRFGRMTSLRILQPSDDVETLAGVLAKGLTLADAGIVVQDVRAKAIAASEGTTDFGQYFFYFSFFLVVAALLLTGLFFRVGVEQRLREIGLLEAIGLSPSAVRGLFLREGAVLAAAGALLGVAGAIGYASLIMLGLRTWWVGAVGTTALRVQPSPLMLAIGAIAGFLTALAVIALMLRRVGRAPVPSLLKGSLEAGPAGERRARRTPRLLRAGSWGRAAIAAVLAIALLVAAAAGWIAEAGAFFGAGGAALAAGLFALSAWLRRPPAAPAPGPAWRRLLALGVSSARARPGRSVLAAALIAFATFVVVAVGAFHREETGSPDDPASGTGGYILLAESAVPLMFDPATAEGRASYGLDSPEFAPVLAGTTFDLFRLRPGDDGSCLNLYRPENPRIVAPTSGFVERGGRFTFAASLAETDAERANPWLLLNRSLPDGVVPAIVDATSLQYVFHAALGDELTVQTSGGAPARLRFVASLSHSVFQSEILIGDAHFVRLFPQHEGHRLWLVDGDPSRRDAIARLLEQRMSDAGMVAIDPAERLRAFQEVENTYLSTFQALGALGLVLGTLGLAAVVVRNVLERRREMALLSAVGYRPGSLRLLVAGEVGLIVASGVVLGAAAALIAVQPAIARQGGGVPVAVVGGVIAAVAASGLLATLIATAVAARLPVVASLRAE
jgi:ABC-type antimicrobial peptide transport system permease subunit